VCASNVYTAIYIEMETKIIVAMTALLLNSTVSPCKT
jgi:hypothetical protein